MAKRNWGVTQNEHDCIELGSKINLAVTTPSGETAQVRITKKEAAFLLEEYGALGKQEFGIYLDGNMDISNAESFIKPKI